MGNSQADVAGGPPGTRPWQIVVHNFAEADSLLSDALCDIIMDMRSHIRFLQNSYTLQGQEKVLLLEEAESIKEKLVQVVEGIDYAHTPD